MLSLCDVHSPLRLPVSAMQRWLSCMLYSHCAWCWSFCLRVTFVSCTPHPLMHSTAHTSHNVFLIRSYAFSFRAKRDLKRIKRKDKYSCTRTLSLLMICETKVFVFVKRATNDKKWEKEKRTMASCENLCLKQMSKWWLPCLVAFICPALCRKQHETSYELHHVYMLSHAECHRWLNKNVILRVPPRKMCTIENKTVVEFIDFQYYIKSNGQKLSFTLLPLPPLLRALTQSFYAESVK